MSKCPFLLLVVGGPTFEDEFAPVFLVHPCAPAVVVLGCPAYVPRVQAPGLIADVVCGYVTSIPGLPICPPADEGHQRDGPALLTLRVSAQGLELLSYGGAALEFVPDEGLDAREICLPARIRHLRERAGSPFLASPRRSDTDGLVTHATHPAVVRQDAPVTLARLAEAVVCQGNRLAALLVISNRVRQHRGDEQGNQALPAGVVEDMPHYIAVEMLQISAT